MSLHRCDKKLKSIKRFKDCEIRKEKKYITIRKMQFLTPKNGSTVFNLTLWISNFIKQKYHRRK